MASIMPLSFLEALNSCSVSSAAVITRFDDCEGESMSHTQQVALSSLHFERNRDDGREAASDSKQKQQ